MSKYINEECALVETVEKWSKVDILNDDTSNHSTAIHNRVTPENLLMGKWGKYIKVKFT